MLDDRADSDRGAVSTYAAVFPQAECSRVEELELLINALTAFDPKEAPREEFTTLFKMAVQSLELSEETVAQLLSTTRTTVNRWTRGCNVPSRSLRKPVFNALVKEANRKLKQRHNLMGSVAA